MKQVTKAYKQAMNKRLRDRSYMIVSVGIVSNEAQGTARVSSNSYYLSNNIDLFKDGKVLNTYATLEQNVFKCDGSMIFPPEQTGYEQLASGVCCMGKGIRTAITISFDKAYDIKGLTINFGEYYPKRFTVKTSDNTTKTYNNNQSVWTTEDSFDATESLTITASTFNNGNSKRLRIESILMGIGIVFQNEDIETANFTESASFISEELPQIDFNVTCYDKDKKFSVDDSNSFINYLEAGQEITTSLGITLEDGSVEYVTLPITYLSSWSSNNEKVSFTSVDRFAFLTGKYTGGNTIHTRTLYDDAIAVLIDAGLEPDEYEVSDYLRSITVVNPLPEVSHAECLQLIANAGCCLLKQNDLGMITLTPNFENIVEPEDLVIETNGSETAWSKPSTIRTGADTFYADLSKDYFTMDGSLEFLPTDMSLVGDTGYVSKVVSSDTGNCSSQVEITNMIPDDYAWASGVADGPGYHFEPNNPGHMIELNYMQPFYSFVYCCVNNMPLTVGKYYFRPIFNDNAQRVCGFRLRFSNSSAVDWDASTVIRSTDSVELNITSETNITIEIILVTGVSSSYTGKYYIKPILERYKYTPPPTLTIKLPTAYTYYGVSLRFFNPMQKFTIRTYEDEELIDTVPIVAEVTDQTLFEITHSFQSFDTMEITFEKTYKPYQRVILTQFSFGKLSEYELKREDMGENPIGTVEPKVQSVGVRVFTFQNGQQGEQPQALDDNVFSVFNVNPIGNNITFENQLISTRNHATEVAKWIANYYANNITYEVNYRGEPRIEAADYIFMESEILDSLQVEVESHSIDFDGSIKGKLELRRALNLVSG